MEKKINIAELLKDCPQGMELDCTCADNVVFDKIIEYEQIKCVIGECRDPLILDKYGRLLRICCPKCVIFPKGKTTWEGFVPPCKFKDGDVISNDVCICIYNGNENDKYYGSYVSIGHIDFPNYFINRTENNYFTKGNAHLATEEEKQKLFDVIKANGYKWNAETKTLEKLIQPKFKVGDIIQDTDSYKVKIIEVNVECYGYESVIAKGIGCIGFDEQDNWELVPNKFDITTLVPFESKVLVRDGLSSKWQPAIWGFYDEDGYEYHYQVVGGYGFCYCIPYETNKELLGTTNDCDDYFKTW